MLNLLCGWEGTKVFLGLFTVSGSGGCVETQGGLGSGRPTLNGIHQWSFLDQSVLLLVVSGNLSGARS